MVGRILFLIKSIRFIPALVVSLRSKESEIIAYECRRWLDCNNIQLTYKRGFITLMMQFPEYRSLVYHRTGCEWLRHLGRGQNNLYFHTPSKRIGKGLVIWHGYSTVINAKEIGEDCSIWHNVTIGKKTLMDLKTDRR